MLIGNHWADHEAKNGMQFHDINWQEYAEADDRTMVACVAQHLIKRWWEESFAKDMRQKQVLQIEEESEEEIPLNESDGTFPLEQELAPEEAGPWEVEEEVGRWMHGEIGHQPTNSDQSETKRARGDEGQERGSCASAGPLWDTEPTKPETLATPAQGC